MKHLAQFLSFAIIMGLHTGTVRAVSDPPLFSCIQPIGTTKVAYSSGTHGIPGDTRQFTGSDTVYTIDQAHLLQCFCPADSSSGIQSNWWKVDSLSAEDQDFFVRRGWVYVPNGQPWGLAEGPYLVKNDSFQCHEEGRGGGNGSSGQGGSNNQTSSSSSSSSSSDGSGGAVLGADTLAATGSAQKIVLLYVVGGFSALLAYRLGRG